MRPTGQARRVLLYVFLLMIVATGAIAALSLVSGSWQTSPLILGSTAIVGFGAVLPRNQKELTAFLAKMPEIDDPSIFGLPRNIDKAVQRAATEAVLGSLKTLSLAVEEGGGLNKEEELKLLSPVLKLWTQTYKQIKDSKFPPIKNA